MVVLQNRLRFLLRTIVLVVDQASIVLSLVILEMKLERKEIGLDPKISRNDKTRKDQGRSVDYSSIAADCAL
jgi:hypothetical protein